MRARNAGPTPEEVDKVLQYDILDRLPADLRRVVWDAPIALDLRQVRTMLNAERRGNNPRAVDKLTDAVLRQFPDWHREWNKGT